MVLWGAACWANEEAGQAVSLLAKQCGACHSEKVRLSGLDLTSREGLLKGGSKGPAVKLDQVEQSILLAAVHRKDGVAAMPPTKALAADEVALLERWLKAGAPWGEAKATAAPQWWSFRAPQRPEIPAAAKGREIDYFLERAIAGQGLAKAPAAPRATLLRRVYMDLTGLAPTAEEVNRFAADRDPKAYEKVIDQLLASPRYGEKWARHWLDLVRYSDTAGFELDSYIPDAWRYRDYVIDSFNKDKPYDQFVKEQIAGDEYWPEDTEANTGTGLYCIGPNRDLFPDQADINRVEILTDYTDTTASVFLGLTAGCARCHDHKFDPIPQKDYFRLQAVFAPAVKTKVALNRLGSLGWETGENVREIQLRELGEQIRTIQDPCKKRLYDAKLMKLSAEVQAAIQTPEDQKTPRQRELATEYGSAVRVTDEEIRECLDEQQRAALHNIERRLVTMFQGYAPKPFSCGITDVGDFSPKTFVPAKGKAEPVEVTPGFFSALGGGDIPERSFARPVTGPIPMFPTTGRRHALAEWLTKPDHPLTARVMVNRVWQYHFGRGIVATPSDYGSRGAAPTHPELLDYLAAEFVAQGWSLKKLHKQILLSEAYQRDSQPSAGVREKDPENLYLSHFRRRRLTSDELRDNLLLASGELNLKMHGKPVVPPLAEEEMFGMIGRAEQMWVVSSNPEDFRRRSIYLFQKRTFRMPMMEVFDTPEPMLTCPRRDASTTAPQSLTLLNGSFAMERARALARRGSVEAIFEAVLLRKPDAEEAKRLSTAFANLEAKAGGREQALTEIARAILNTNEFLYVD
jgi:hypothetical protein